MRSITISPVLFVLLFFTAPLTADTSALGGPVDLLRPEWMKAGNYVTYLYSVTVSGVTGTMHIKVIVKNDTTPYLNQLRIEKYGEQDPSRLSTR